jgi:predicted transcriptional regulator
MKDLKKIRQDLSLSQEQMALRIGVTLSYYQKVEQGQVRAAAGFIRKFIIAFPEQSTDIFFKEGGLSIWQN